MDDMVKKGRGKRSEETRRRMSEAQLGKKCSEESKRKMSIAHMGKKHALGCKRSEEERRKISINQMGENNNMYGRTGENSPIYGRKHTEQEKRKMSVAAKKRWKRLRIL